MDRPVAPNGLPTDQVVDSTSGAVVVEVVTYPVVDMLSHSFVGIRDPAAEVTVGTADDGTAVVVSTAS